MQVLLRRLDGDTVRDVELISESISVGSAANQQIQLLGKDIPGEYARFQFVSGSLRLTCEGRNTFIVDGDRTRSATLSVDSLVEVGGHQIRIIKPPSGFDAALELRVDPDVLSSDYEAAFGTDLDESWLSRRAPAWLGFLAVVVIALILPFASIVLKQDTTETGSDAVPLLPVFTDATWSTGPLHPAHELVIGDDCASCHTDLFQRVADQTCSDCHETILDHFDQTMVEQTGISHQRCATCHREHNEPEHLVVTADGICTNCHVNLDEDIQAVGFSENEHPPFRAEILKPSSDASGTGLSFQWQPQLVLVAGAREDSNLQFPHDIHLDEVKVRNTNDNSALGCADCHGLADDGEHFLPITMADHCIGCHELAFDETAPDRQLPHGQPREVVHTIEGFYANAYLTQRPDSTNTSRRRRPDRNQQQAACTSSPQVCAEQSTLEEVVRQFSVQGCVTCHEVSESTATDIFSRYQVHPVRLVNDYFPSASFDHVSHLVMDDTSGDGACLSCHEADASSSSEDLLMPDIDGCTDCHGDESVSDVVVLGCVDCHAYHPGYSGLAAQESEQ